MTINQCDNSSGGHSTSSPVNQSIMNDRMLHHDEGREGGAAHVLHVLVVRGIFRSARATINNGGLGVCCCYPGRGPWNFRIPRQIPSSNLPPFFRCVHNLWHSCCIFKVWEHLKFRRMHIVWRRGVPKSGNPARQSRPRPVACYRKVRLTLATPALSLSLSLALCLAQSIKKLFKFS